MLLVGLALRIVSPELDIRFHTFETYAVLNPLSVAIPFSYIQCHLARGRLLHTTPQQ